jgi:hypothetical protein
MGENGRNGFLAKRVSGKVTVEQLLSFAFGVVFILIMLALAVAIPEVEEQRAKRMELAFRIVMALAAAGIGAMIPGLLNVDMKASNRLQIRAAGALAVFVIVFLLNPPRWITRGENEAQPDSGAGVVLLVQGFDLHGLLGFGLAQADEGISLDSAPSNAARASQESTESLFGYRGRAASNLTAEQRPLQSRAGRVALVVEPRSLVGSVGATRM